MKKVMYFTSLCIAWVVVVFILAFVLVVCGLFPFRAGWGYSLGAGCGHPQLWLISLGIVFLLRPVLYKAIFKVHKSFSKSTGIVIIIFGAIWLAMNLGSKLLGLLLTS